MNEYEGMFFVAKENRIANRDKVDKTTAIPFPNDLFYFVNQDKMSFFMDVLNSDDWSITAERDSEKKVTFLLQDKDGIINDVEHMKFHAAVFTMSWADFNKKVKELRDFLFHEIKAKTLRGPDAATIDSWERRRKVLKGLSDSELFLRSEEIHELDEEIDMATPQKV